MPKKTIIWKCGKCGREFTTEEDAQECESTHGVRFENPVPSFHPGDELAPSYLIIEVRKLYGNPVTYHYKRI